MALLIGSIAKDTAGALAYAVTFLPVFLIVCFRVVTYPFDVAVSMSIYFLARNRKNRAMRAWYLCPVAWNEVIWLPLPFVGKLLALTVRQDREEGFKRIAFVAAERSLQRRAAVAALIEVALDDLRARSVSKMADVTDRLGWITDAPAELPKELVSALPRFDRVAQHVGQYLM